MIVVDASVLVVALADDGAAGARARRRLAGESLIAPEIIDLEVASVLRRRSLADAVPASRAKTALGDLAELPMRRVSHRALLGRCWQLRRDVTIYDAAYVALAEVLSVQLLTADARLARAPGLRCDVELMSSGVGG